MTDQSVSLDGDMRKTRSKASRGASSARRRLVLVPAKGKPKARRSPKRLATPAITGRADRATRSASRRDDILAASLEEFAASGFAATRLEDVAKRAGVAKGTIYLYFRDKETLFHELLVSMFAPMIGALDSAKNSDLPPRAIAEKMLDLFQREVLGTRRKDVVRLILTEGTRFPKLAEFHYQEVIGPVMALIGGVMKRAHKRGEIRHDALVRFPQLLVAPGLVAILWAGLFERFAPLDISNMMRTHLDILFGKRTEQ